MKHFTLILAAAAMSLSAYAATPSVSANLTAKQAPATIAKFDGSSLRQSRAAEAEIWSLSGYTASSGSLVQASTTVNVTIDGDQMTITDFSPYLPEMGITGTINGDKVEFANKQYIGQDTNWGDEAYFLATVAQISGNSITGWESVGDSFSFVYDAEAGTMYAEDEYFTFFINTGDGDTPNDYYTMWMDPEFAKMEIGDVVVLPEGVTAEDWLLTDDEGAAQVVKVAIDGNDIYFGGFDEEALPNAWAKGTIDGSTITVENLQYLGFMEAYSMPAYLLGAQFTNDGQSYSIPATFELTYDAAKKTITSDPFFVLCVNAATDRIYYLDIFYNPAWQWVDPNAEIGAPLNPQFYGFAPYNAADGYGGMVWIISQLSDTGAMIPADNLFYSVFADDEIYVLEPDDYVVDEPISVIPYYFEPEDMSGDYGIYIDEFGANTRAVWFYREIYDNVGCQVIYIDGDKELRSSTIWFDINTETLTEEPWNGENGIESVAADKSVKNVEFYNIAGQKVQNPKGLVIMKVNYADGTTKAVKVSK